METRPVEDEIDLFELFQKLYQERWLILGITAITTLITLLVSFLIPKTYKAEVFFEIPIFQTSQNIQIQNIQIINYPELSDAFKSYEKYRKFPFEAKISQIRNSPNIGKIEVEGSSPEEAKKNLSEVINIINKELFSEKLNVIKENLNKRINAIDITIKEFVSKRSIYDPTKIADLLTEKERIQKWLQNPQIISPLDIIVSSEPVRPKPLLYTAIGFITGIFLGIFVALIKEAIKSRT